ncbi:MAG: hypothetical protein ISP52_05080 [Flavobacteriaceae bacterium]|nr:hypothetical protein [Flavobacteriaceae bacterium]
MDYLNATVYILRSLVFIGALYMWLHWAVITLVFDDTGTLDYMDFVFGFIFNLGLFMSLFPIKKVFLVVPTVLILFTSYIYSNTILFGKNWEDGSIGLLVNILAAFLIVALQKRNGACNT